MWTGHQQHGMMGAAPLEGGQRRHKGLIIVQLGRQEHCRPDIRLGLGALLGSRLARRHQVLHLLCAQVQRLQGRHTASHCLRICSRIAYMLLCHEVWSSLCMAFPGWGLCPT